MIRLFAALLGALTAMALAGMQGLAPADQRMIGSVLVLIWTLWAGASIIMRVEDREPRYACRPRFWRWKGGWRLGRWKVLMPAEADDLVEDMQLLADASRTAREIEGAKAIMFEWRTRLIDEAEAQRQDDARSEGWRD